MKKRSGKGTGKVNKGAPSGVIISLLLHAAAFAVAGVFVVITVMKPPVPDFVAKPLMTRPKMSLKRPIVKVKTSSSPSTESRIVVKLKMAKMPEISIPDLTGTGDNLMSGMCGIGIDDIGFLDPVASNPFGDPVTTGNDLEVTYYNFCRKRSGVQKLITENEYFDIIRRFVEGDWNTSMFNSYYRSPRKLYAQTVTVPRVTSIAAPLCFGEDPKLNYKCWAAHYKATIKHKDGITFRLWGLSDNVLNVRINDKVVLSANGSWEGNNAYLINENFQGSAPGSRTTQSEGDSGSYIVGNSKETLMGSEWITLEPGKEYDFQAITGDGPGGQFYAILLAEVQDEYYEKNDRGVPIWDLFATAPLSWEAQDSILMDSVVDDYNVTNIRHYFIVE
ncbi:MAG: hypothetical protein JXR23_05920 [Pontiellaceae bacterium]|nr:hypothetical protein [Pontiellaceae bacterium]